MAKITPDSLRAAHAKCLERGEATSASNMSYHAGCSTEGFYWAKNNRKEIAKVLEELNWDSRTNKLIDRTAEKTENKSKLNPKEIADALKAGLTLQQIKDSKDLGIL